MGVGSTCYSCRRYLECTTCDRCHEEVCKEFCLVKEHPYRSNLFGKMDICSECAYGGSFVHGLMEEGKWRMHDGKDAPSKLDIIIEKLDQLLERERIKKP